MLTTGRFSLGWERDGETLVQIITGEIPEIYIAILEDQPGTGQGFFTREGNQITEAPWLLVETFQGSDLIWTELRYANDFRLFDFNGNGIPDILVHFNQIFEGGYAGVYRIFRYIDGEYRNRRCTAELFSI